MSIDGGAHQVNHLGPPKRLTANQPSILLSTEENELVFKLLNDRCSTLSTAVVQLLVTSPPHHSKWAKHTTGVACFVKDNCARGYFIEVYEIDTKRLCVWRQEMYHQFDYRAVRPNFHTFEADSCRAGLYFADSNEANDFHRIVESKTRLLEKRRSSKVPQNNKYSNSLTRTDHLALPPPPNKQEESNKKRKKSKFRKEDIGPPTNFKHVQHVGLSPESNYLTGEIDPEYKKFFEFAGIPEFQLQEPQLRDFLYDFIEKKGGIDVCLQDMNRALSQSEQPEFTPTPPPNRHRPVPPIPHQPPTSNYQLKNNSTSKSQQQSFYAHPTPPPPPPPLPPPLPPSMSSGGAIPPPPPPLPSGPLPSLSKSNHSSAVSNSKNSNSRPSPLGDVRSALLEDIRRGKPLKPVDQESLSSKSTGSNNEPGRDALLNDIKKGVQLKAVRNKEEKPASNNSPCGIAGALVRALEERQRAMQHSDDSDSSSDTPDEDWE